MPESIAGWRPKGGWLGHRWVCRAATAGPIRAMGGR